MKRITKISDLVIGKQYLQISKQFNNAHNNVTCVSDDYSGLNRDIAYFCFKNLEIKWIPNIFF